MGPFTFMSAYILGFFLKKNLLSHFLSYVVVKFCSLQESCVFSFVFALKFESF